MGTCRCLVRRSNDDYYVATSKSLEVEPGYYYRVHADHIVFEGDDRQKRPSHLQTASGYPKSKQNKSPFLIEFREQPLIWATGVTFLNYDSII